MEVDTPPRASARPHASATSTRSVAEAPESPSTRLRRSALLLTVLMSLALGCRGEGEVLDLSAPLGEPAAGLCALDILDASSGLDVSRTLMSDWEAGSCYELTLTNNAESPQEWWVLVELTPAAASVDNRWNHTSTAIGDTVSEWRGIQSSNNTRLEVGAATVVGACFSC